MQTVFLPKPGDEVIRTFYTSGTIKEKQYLRNGVPANGWSRKEYFENGREKLAECFSTELLIEQILYDESGKILFHKIYSHAQKKLIDRPVITKVIRHNTVSGVAHMGFYFRHLPAISQFIGAEYDSDSLEKAYQNFLKVISEDDEIETDDGQFRWTIKGKSMGFSIVFERYEMLYQWGLFTGDEDEYNKAKYFMEQIMGEKL